MPTHANPGVVLAKDPNSSPLAQHASTRLSAFAYTVYGYNSPDNDRPCLLAFSAQLPTLPGIYLLGNGYRCFQTTLMRFTSPDSLSPFEAGGLNAYAYCAGDPVNHTDPSGHMPNTQSGSTIGQRNTPAKHQRLAPTRPSNAAARIAILTKQRESQLVTRTGLSNFSSYLKSLGVPGNLEHRAPLNARVEKITGEIKNTDDRLLIIQHGTGRIDTSPVDVQELHQPMTSPENIAKNAAIQQQSPTQITKVQQRNSDVRQGDEH